MIDATFRVDLNFQSPAARRGLLLSSMPRVNRQVKVNKGFQLKEQFNRR
jgi:hypothetical protein